MMKAVGVKEFKEFHKGKHAVYAYFLTPEGAVVEIEAPITEALFTELSQKMLIRTDEPNGEGRGKTSGADDPF